MGIKNIIRADIKIAILISMVWAIMSPLKSQLQGLLSVETIGLAMLIAGLSVELLSFLSKTTTFKSSTAIIIVYDVMYTTIVAVANATASDRALAFIIVFASIPYAVLARNVGNKFKVLLGGTYPPKIAEKVYLRLSVLENRATLITVGIVSALSSMGVDTRTILWLFVVFSAIETVVSVYSFKKYYKNIE